MTAIVFINDEFKSIQNSQLKQTVGYFHEKLFRDRTTYMTINVKQSSV